MRPRAFAGTKMKSNAREIILSIQMIDRVMMIENVPMGSIEAGFNLGGTGQGGGSPMGGTG
jgi:hypothetical protein